MLALGLALSLPLFAVNGLYRAIFRYSGFHVLYTMNSTLLIYTVLFFLFFVLLIPDVPKYLGILQPLFFANGTIFLRLFVRRWLGGYGNKKDREGVPIALIYGAGSAGRQLATGLAMSPDVIIGGYLDDDDRLHGHYLNGLPIYNPAKLAEIKSKQNISQVFLALPSASRRRRAEIVDALLPYNLEVRTLPGLMDLTSGKVQVSDLKELEIEDLLGRDAVPPDLALLGKNNSGKVVMVTGAGGSIGSELCRQILRTEPAKLLLVELSEFSLYAIEVELRVQLEGQRKVEIIPLLADVRNADRISEIISTWRPQTVYHAAAYKHVPLVEHNPAEGVLNNVLGTLVIAKQSLIHGVSDFVLISTDKAVRPTNIMGASKRLAEMVVQALANNEGKDERTIDVRFETRMSMVRFGNVLGSSGSVVPLFRRQIQNGGPITLTDEQITRYFMTISEAAQLVIQAAALAELKSYSEPSSFQKVPLTKAEVFILDMGKSVKIVDLASKMIELSGLTIQNEENPQGDIAIKITGMRPGEKLYEELLIGDNPVPTSHPRIMKAQEDYLSWYELEPHLNELISAARNNDVFRIKDLLKLMVKGYVPEAGLVDWVWLEKNAEFA